MPRPSASLLRADIDKALDEFDIEASKCISDKAVLLTVELTDRTPFLTGHAAFSWIPTIGIGTGEFVENTEGSDVTQRAKQRAGLATLKGYHISMGGITIENQARYMQELNMGSSRKAPAMFVEATIQKVAAL